MIWKKTGLKGILIFFSVDFNPIYTNNISDIHKYLKKGTLYKIMFGLINKIFIEILSDMASATNHTKCVTQPTLINLHLNEYSQAFHYYPN